MDKRIPKNTFTLKGMSNIFAPTDPDKKRDQIIPLHIENLIPFDQHPFKLYEGKRFDDMIESIRENGVIIPIIVRPVDGITFEILSGHNRVNAAKVVGMETIPSMVREGLTEEEAMLIVTETNLMQRSFADLTHSERAVALSMHHESIKKQGHRSDLLKDIEEMLNTVSSNDSETFGALRQKSDSREQMAAQYDLSSRTIAYYLRINKLIAPFKIRLDDGSLALRSAVTLSYLPEEEQQTIGDVLESSEYKIDMKMADALRSLSEKAPLSQEGVEMILSGAGKPKKAKAAGFKLKSKIVSKYFTPDQNTKEIEDIIIKALEHYFHRT